MQPLLLNKLKDQWSELKSKTNHYWSEREANEQRALKIGGAVVGVLLMYLLIISPVFQHLANLREAISHDQKTLAWMRGMDAALSSYSHENSPHPQKITPIELLSALQTAVNKSSLSQGLTGMKQSGNANIEMHFKNVSFDALIALLTSTLTNTPANLSQFSATSTGDTPGTVNADLVLSLATSAK